MSSDTAAQPPETASRPSPRTPQSTAAREAVDNPEPRSGTEDPKPARAWRPGRPRRHIGPRDRSGRVWAWVTAGAIAAFCVALALGATRLYVDVGEIVDSPERTVDAFLEALLDQRDADAAAAWLCADKSDRDLSEAVAALSYIDGPGDFAWGES